MTITYDVAGDGPTVLLLHSSVCDRRMWDAQWQPLLDAGFRVIRCDLRGHGETPAAQAPYNDADDVTAVLDELKADRTALVGSSFGGKVAVELAARRPDRVSDLALLCSAPVNQEESTVLADFDEREDVLWEAGDLDGLVEINLNTWLGPETTPQARQQVAEMQRNNFVIQLAAEDVDSIDYPVVPAAITARTLAVSGRHDLIDFRQFAAELPDLVSGARHHELGWAGHLPNIERPAEITTLLLDFLAEPA